MVGQEEYQLPPEIAAFQTRLDLSVNLFRQIDGGRIPYSNMVQQLDNVLRIYNQIPTDYRLEIEVNKTGYDDVGGQDFDFARRVITGDKSRYRYFVMVRAQIENLSQMPENGSGVVLSRWDGGPVGPTAFELMRIRRGVFDHDSKIWPENILAMKIVPTRIPLPKPA